MDDKTVLDLLARVAGLERRAAFPRMGVITDTDPLSVALGGATDTPYTDVKAIAGLALAVDDLVSVLTFGNDRIILGRIADGTGVQTAGPSGSDSGITSATVTALTSGPSITVAAAGTYEITIGLTMAQTGTGVSTGIGALRIDGVAQGGSPNAATDRCYFVATAQFGAASIEKTIIRTLDAGDVLTIGRAAVGGIAWAFLEGYIQIRPAR